MGAWYAKGKDVEIDVWGPVCVMTGNGDGDGMWSGDGREGRRE